MKLAASLRRKQTSSDTSSGSTEAAQGVLTREHLLHRLVEVCLQKWGEDVAGADRIDAQALPAVFGGRVLRDPHDTVLRGGVRAAAHGRDHAVHRGHVDDGAV